MGAARDFDQDENLDFSDLSDTNQSALEKAKSRWGNAEVIRGDDGYNPSDLASAENSSIATSSNSGISDNETLMKDATTTQSSSWRNNVSGGGTHKSRNAASKGGAKNRAMSFFKGKGAFATTGGVIGGVGALIFAGTFNMVSLMSNHITEMVTEKLNSASISMNKRSSKVFKLKFNTKGVNCVAGIVCRMSRVTDRNLKNLREAGFHVEVEDGKGILGRKKISSIKYIKAGHEIPLDSSSEIKSVLTNNPEVREALKRGYNGRFASFLDKKWQKLKGWFSFKKWRKNNKGKTEEEIDEDMKKTANDHSKEEDADGKSRKGDPDPEDGKVEKGDKGTSAVKDKLKSNSDKLKKGFKNARQKSIAAANTIKGVGETLSGPLNAIDKICGVYALVTMGWSVAKVAKVEVFAQFGLSFLSMSSKIRSGDATQEEVTAQGNSLMGIANKKDSDEKKDSDQSDSNTSRLKEAFAFFADSAEENSPGKSATDSQGWRAVAYGDRVSKLDNSAKDYQVGITGALAKIMDTFTSGTLGWVVRKGCKVATVTTAVVGAAVVVASLVACATTACVAEVLGSIAWGAAVGVALSLALTVLKDKAMDEISLHVAQGLTGTILNDSTKGENFGNAIMSGSAAMMSKNTMAGSGGVLTKSQAVAFYHETERQIAENAEEIRKTRSPFDPNTRHTFLGSIVSNMLPYSKQISSISGFLPSIIGGAQRSFAAITPGAHAANDANFIANMDTCEDKTIKDTGAATDIFCNVYTGIDMKIADKDTDQVIDELKSSGDLKEKDNSGDGDTDDMLSTVEMGTDLKKYEKYCFNRKKPIGASEDDDDDNFGAICNSDKNPKANLYALFLTDVRVEEGMNEDFKPDEGGGSGSSSSSSGGVDPDLAKLSGEFVWPVKGVKVNGDSIEGVGPDQDFGPRSFFDGFSSTHYGIDFGSATFGSAAPVYAAADGEVVYGGDAETVGWGAGSHYVAIKHNGDIYTTYSHMRSHSVHKGDKVKKGQQIGVTGAEGNASGEHLHFETKKGTGVPGEKGAFNPMDLIKGNT